MRYVLRVVLPLSLALTGVLLALYLASDDPRFAVHRVFRSPDQHFTWVGFADVRDRDVRGVAHARHERRRRLPLHEVAARHADRAVRLGVTSAVVTTFVGGYAAAATGESNPFVAVAGLTKIDAVLASCSSRSSCSRSAANV